MRWALFHFGDVGCSCFRSRLALSALPLRRSSFHRVSGLLPSLQSPEQGRRVMKSFRIECEHRTGARVFGRSSTVSDNHLVTWKFAATRSELVRGDENRAFNA